MAKEKETPEVKEVPTEETLNARIAELETDLAQTKKGLSTAHQTLTDRDKELKRTRDVESQISELRDDLQLLATAMSSAGISQDDTTPEKRADVVEQLKQTRKTQEAERGRKEYLAKADSVYERAKVVYANDEDALERIEDQLMSMVPSRLERAEAKVAKAELKEPEKKGIDVEEIREEERRKILEETGQLVADTGGPGGVAGGVPSYTRADLKKLDPKEYKRLFPGGMSDLFEKVAKGEIELVD